MFTPTNDPEDPIWFMEPYSSLLSPFTCFGNDGYNIPNYYHEESVLLSAGNNIAESSNEPVSASSKMDVTNYQGDVNGIVEQDNSRDTTNNHGSSKQNSSRKRTSKGDRHSKIPTAQGLRDRRMRLSLDVARQFFKLQDLLSYDKPSQTVKWLLMQAGPAIEELKKTIEISPSCTNGIKGVSSNSELGEEVVDNTIYEKNGSDLVPKVTTSKVKGKHMRKNAFNREAKELRKKARERARERTQKKQTKVSQGEDVRPFYKIEQQIEDERVPFRIAQDFTDAPVVSENWSLNYYHQEDQTCQFKPIQEFQFHEWEPY